MPSAARAIDYVERVEAAQADTQHMFPLWIRRKTLSNTLYTRGSEREKPPSCGLRHTHTRLVLAASCLNFRPEERHQRERLDQPAPCNYLCELTRGLQRSEGTTKHLLSIWAVRTHQSQQCPVDLRLHATRADACAPGAVHTTTTNWQRYPQCWVRVSES